VPGDTAGEGMERRGGMGVWLEYKEEEEEEEEEEEGGGKLGFC